VTRFAVDVHLAVESPCKGVPIPSRRGDDNRVTIDRDAFAEIVSIACVGRRQSLREGPPLPDAYVDVHRAGAAMSVHVHARRIDDERVVLQRQTSSEIVVVVASRSG